jgi:hypothetical protein
MSRYSRPITRLLARCIPPEQLEEFTCDEE